MGNYRGAPVDQFGNETPSWHNMQNVNLQIQKLDMQTGRVLDIIQLSKEDPDPHGMCIYQGKIHYCDAGIAPGGKDSGSPNAGYVFRIEV